MAVAQELQVWEREDLLTGCQAVSQAVLDRAVDVIRKNPLRAYDAIQLAGCLVMASRATMRGSPIFVTGDHALIEAARQEGLTAWNPSDEP